MKKQGKKIKKPQDRSKLEPRSVQQDNGYSGKSADGNPKGKNKTFVENNAFDTIGDDDL